MKASLRLLAILGLSLSLSSCVGGSLPSSLVSSRQETSSLLSSSPAVSSSERAAPSSSKAVSSSSAKQEPSSSTAVHYTVSIYQSYYIEKEGRYGNPRFDTSVTREAGEPLYKNVKEIQALEECLNPEYYSIGGSGLYELIGFFLNDKCTVAIGYNQIVNSDMDVFYYCRG